MRRLAERFEQLKREKRAGLVTYFMAHDPNSTTTAQLLETLPEAGADIIELGMPFSDPMADGPIIQAAALRALKANATMHGTLELVKTFRQQNVHTPIILMGYYNPLYHMGLEKFVASAKEVGVDGLLIVDLPCEEDDELLRLCDQNQIALIKLVTPTTSEERLKQIIHKARGFIYYVAIAGITGTASGDKTLIAKAVNHIKKQTDLPVIVGFGIKNPQDVSDMASFSDGVVVGSAIVDKIGSGQPMKQVSDFVRTLSAAL